MNAKDIFLKDEDLTERLSAVVSSDWFRKCVAYANAELMEQPNVTTEHLAGARKFQSVLFNISEPEMDSEPMPSSGLHHDLDIPSSDLVKPTTKKGKKR